MKQLDRRTFLGGATAAVAAVASPVALSASSPAKASRAGYLHLLTTPSSVAAFTGDGRIDLSRDGHRWQGRGAEGTVDFRTEITAGAMGLHVAAPELALTRIRLRWNIPVSPGVLVLGDAWERSYGDLAWRSLVPERALPWYFATHEHGTTHGYGVRTGAAAFCFWQVDTDGVSLWLDVSNGGNGVLLGQRELHVAAIVSRQGVSSEPPHATVGALCRLMCPKPRLVSGAVYGTNDWYYAYGNNSAEGILRDTDLIVSLAPKGGTRPFSLVDGGWAGSGSASDIPDSNPKFPDMAGLAAEIRRRDARPGIWIRPTMAPKGAQPQLLLTNSRFGPGSHSDADPVYDPTIPEAMEAMMAKVKQVVDWKYELVKHDFSTYDLFGQWGFQMGPSPTRPRWSFHDRSLTNAEIVLDLYKRIRTVAGEKTVVLGCNTVGHLAAGLFELNRTGDDTSGQHWERTRRMGVNTLSYRLPQNGTFFTVDADCVGITKAVPWEMNRQWMDLIARSGSALFLSPDPAAIGPDQKTAIAEAFAIAAAGNSSGYAEDWLTSTTPERWQFKTGGSGTPTQKQYDWCGPNGCDPYPI